MRAIRRQWGLLKPMVIFLPMVYVLVVVGNWLRVHWSEIVVLFGYPRYGQLLDEIKALQQQENAAAPQPVVLSAEELLRKANVGEFMNDGWFDGPGPDRTENPV